MTLRNLLTKIPFDSILPFILKENGASPAYCYKQAYDILLHIEPCEDGCCDIEVKMHEDWDGTKYVSASQIEGDWWSTYIDGEIVVEDGINITDEELAYKLLWHLTFYGFSHEEIFETIEGMGNDGYHDTIFGLMAREVYRKETLQWANKAIKKSIEKSAVFHISNDMNDIFLSEEEWHYIDKRKHHCNRMKRMRSHRLRLRLKYLANKDRCEHTIQRLLKGQSGTTITKNDLAFLDNQNGRAGTEFQSRSYNKAKRVDYLIELIDKFKALDEAKVIGMAAVRIATSPHHPVTNQELDKIKTKISSMLHEPEPIFIIATDNSLSEEMALMIVGVVPSE